MKDILIVSYTILVVLLQIVSVFVYLTHFFGLKKNTLRAFLLLFLSYLASKASLKFGNTSYNIHFIFFIFLLFFIFKAFDGSVYKKLFHFCFLCFFLTVQTKVGYLFYLSDIHLANLWFFIFFMSITLIFNLFVLLLKRFDFANDMYLSKEEYLVLGIIPLSSVVLLQFRFVEDKYVLSVLYFVLFLLNVVAVFLYYFLLDKNYHLQLLQVERLQYKYYEDFLKQEKDLSVLRHDLKNILSSIGYYIESKEYNRAEKLIEELVDYKALNVKYTGLLAIDSVLNNKLKMMDEKAIAYELDFQLPKDLFIDKIAIDLCSILSNLLDNAIEALLSNSNIEGPIIIKLKYHKDNLVMKVVNPCIDDFCSDYNQDKVQSSKGLRYGIGLWSVKDKVKNHNGYYDFQIKKAAFHAMVVLPIE